MSNVGYGNHDATLPGSAAESVEGRKAPGTKPGTGETRTPPPDGERPESTPGDGAGPGQAQGDEVDPGAG